MYNSVFDYTNSNILSILRALIIIYSILVIGIKFLALIVKRNRSIFKQEKNIIISENPEIQEQQSTTLKETATNFSLIIILCLCAVVFFLVQHGDHGNNICQHNLTEYWNILLFCLLSISFTAHDIDNLLNMNFTNSIIFTKYFKTFELIVLTLYIPMTILLIIFCW